MISLSHLNDQGEAHMVDVSEKAITTRSATARGRVLAEAATLALIREGAAKKGDVLATARIAGIMAAKKTSDLIPLCHPLMIAKVSVTFELSIDHIDVEATVKVEGKTGVEMEALTACSVACLTIYDMLKAVDRAMKITDLRVVEKSGGKSGLFQAE
jgi:cyclic pyranopterin monophosphate synthase